jgi:DnaA regulatory inactivator Hda
MVGIRSQITAPIQRHNHMIQLVLPLLSPPRYSFENLIVHAGNEKAVSTLKKVYGAASGPYPNLFLHGPSGTGKTHILRSILELFKNTNQQYDTKIVEPEGSPPSFPELVRFSESADIDLPSVIAVDDIHLLAPGDSACLWNVSNKLTRFGAPLLAASEFAPESIFPDNSHLKSRLLSGLVFELDLPDDRSRLLIMDKMVSDRQIRVSPDVYSYLVRRKSRNIKELEKLFDTLDAASLETKRRITIPFIKLLEKDGRF